MTISVKGLVFLPAKPIPNLYESYQGWVEAGKPDGYVHDLAEILITAGIPIVDAQEVNGVYVKSRLRKVPPVKKLRQVNTPKRTLAEVKVRKEGIYVAQDTGQTLMYNGKPLTEEGPEDDTSNTE